jgi:hypothetical protein
MAKSVYIKTGLTGGTTSDLDGIDGANLAADHVAIVYESDKRYDYILDATSGAAESSPSIIAPDVNPGTKRWILQEIINAADLISNTDVDTGTETVDSFADTLGRMAVWFYAVDNGSGTNMRAGMVMACWDEVADSTPVKVETSTSDIGTTLGVVSIAVDKSGSTVRLRVTTTSDNWACYVSRRLVG